MELEIEKLSNLGLGIGKKDGKVYFIENTCPGDIIDAKIIKNNKNYSIAQIEKILTPSPHRIEPFCPMQKVCGSCQLQFIDYEYQLKLKKEIVEDTIKTIGGIDIEIQDPIPSPQIKEFRHKVQCPVSQTKVSKRILAGYYKPKSHEIVNIKHCPIQPEICDRILEFIRTSALEFGLSGYNEKKHTGDIRHIIIRSSAATGKHMVVLVINATKTFDKLKNFAQNLYDNFKEISGVCVNFNSKKTNVITGEKTECLCGKAFIKERIIDKTFRIGANTFFQVNPKSAENIFAYVKNYIIKNYDNPTLLDAYAGITAFGIVLSDNCKKVVSVEENKESVELAQKTIEANEVKNVELHNMDAAKFFEKELKTKKRRFDLTILDPPRKGCTTESLDYALKLTKNEIIYVSCNPATLARDLKYLKAKGANVKSIQPFDMFCHTYHIENVAVIDVSNCRSQD